MARLYRRTDAGRKAWDTQDARVPLDYRRILGLIGHDTDPAELRARLRWSETAIVAILEELEEQGLVSSFETMPDRTDLDFTGKLTIAQLQRARERAAEDLDFTGSLSLAELRAAQQKKA